MPSESGFTLTLARTFAAPRARVFRAWTDPAMLHSWSAPDDDVVHHAEVDLRPGGHYRLTVRDARGNEHSVGGRYRVIEPISRLVFSWQPAHVAPSAESNVTVELREHGDATEVVVTHDGLRSSDERAREEHGWRTRLEKLAHIL